MGESFKTLKLYFCLLSGIFAVTARGTLFAESLSLPSDPERVRVVVNENGYKTITTADGELMRGVAVMFFRAKWIDRYSQIEYLFREAFYKTLADSGANLLRVCLWDAGLNQYDDACSGNWPVTDFGNQEHVEDYLSRLDTVVDFCSKYGIYVDINFHLTPGTSDPNGYFGEFCDPDDSTLGYIKEQWAVTAPYFKNRTHVFYEPVNEPVKWWPYSYLEGDHIDILAEIFQFVHELAPNTHLSLFSFANATCDWGGCEVGMKDIVDEYKSRYPDDMDWDNVSIAYHPYRTNGSSDAIVELASHYAAFNSENNFPTNAQLSENGYPDVLKGSAQRSESMDGELFTVQTHERLGISWNHWVCGSPEALEANWSGLLLKDAREKGYLWFGSTSAESKRPDMRAQRGGRPGAVQLRITTPEMSISRLDGGDNSNIRILSLSGRTVSALNNGSAILRKHASSALSKPAAGGYIVEIRP